MISSIGHILLTACRILGWIYILSPVLILPLLWETRHRLRLAIAANPGDSLTAFTSAHAVTRAHGTRFPKFWVTLAERVVRLLPDQGGLLFAAVEEAYMTAARQKDLEAKLPRRSSSTINVAVKLVVFLVAVRFVAGAIHRYGFWLVCRRSILTLLAVCNFAAVFVGAIVLVIGLFFKLTATLSVPKRSANVGKQQNAHLGSAHRGLESEPTLTSVQKSSIRTNRPRSSTGLHLVYITENVSAHIDASIDRERIVEFVWSSFNDNDAGPSKIVWDGACWELSIYLTIHNLDRTQKYLVHDVQVHVYYATGAEMPLGNVLHRARIELSQLNSIRHEGKVFEVQPGESVPIELRMGTSLFDTLMTTVVFGVELFWQKISESGIEKGSTPSDCVYVFQHDSSWGKGNCHFVARSIEEIEQNRGKAKIMRILLKAAAEHKRI